MHVCRYGQDGGIYEEGYLIFSVLVCIMQYKIILMTNTMTCINWSLWWLSLIGYYLFCFVYGYFPSSSDWWHLTNFVFPLVSNLSM